MLPSQKAASLIPALLLLFCPLQSQATTKPEQGRPIIHQYLPEDYGAANQNWDGVQDQNGILYFANIDGILIFDGSRWRLALTANESVARSLAIDENNLVYVGAQGDFGYLTTDSDGFPFHQSLLSFVPDSSRDFADVWNIFVTKNGIYFHTAKYLFRWHQNKMHVLSARTSFHTAFSINDTVYVNQRSLGLMQLVGSKMDFLEKGKAFSRTTIRFMLPMAQGSTLIGTSNKGLLQLSGNRLKKFKNNVEDILRLNGLYCGIKLRNGTFAFGTLRGGIVHMDSQGKVIQVLRKEHGLPDNSVYRLYEDSERGLWATMNNGLARVQIQSPIAFFNDKDGLQGSVTSIFRHKGDLYASSQSGLFRLQQGTRSRSRFRRVAPFSFPVWDVVEQNGSMLIASDKGTFELNRKINRRILPQNSNVLAVSLDKKTLYIGTQNGLYILRRAGKSWKVIGKASGVHEQITSLFPARANVLWLGTRFQGALKLKLAHPLDLKPQIVRFDTSSGLPGMNEIWVKSFKQKPLFSTLRGLFQFDETDSTFKPARDGLQDIFEPGQPVYPFHNINNERSWASYMGNIVRLEHKHYRGTKIEKMPFRLINQAITGHTFYEDNDSTLWIGGSNGLIKFMRNQEQAADTLTRFAVILNTVTVNQDSLIYSHFAAPSLEQQPDEVPTLPAQLNNLHFTWMAPSFDSPKQTTFSYFLQGFDSRWSEMRSTDEKEYTNLAEGEYTLRLRSQNVHGQVSPELSYTFYIKPVWYKTGWALFTFILFGAAAFMGILHWRTIKLEKERLYLAWTVQERTAKLEATNTELAQTKGQLERRVHERTIELVKTNVRLRQEIRDRRQAEETVHVSLKEKEVLLNEIHHRVKNNLQVVSSLLGLQILHSEEEQVKSILRESQNRIMSMAFIHQNLIHTRSTARINIIDYLETLTDHIMRSNRSHYMNVHLTRQISRIYTSIDVAISSGLIINELISNAFKHAFNPGQMGEIFLKVREDNNKMICLKIGDNGKRSRVEPDHDDPKTMGIHIVSMLIKKLSGELHMEKKNGLHYTINFKNE